MITHRVLRAPNRDYAVVYWFCCINSWIGAKAQFLHAPYFLNANAGEEAVITLVGDDLGALRPGDADGLCPAEIGRAASTVAPARRRGSIGSSGISRMITPS